MGKDGRFDPKSFAGAVEEKGWTVGSQRGKLREGKRSLGKNDLGGFVGDSKIPKPSNDMPENQKPAIKTENIKTGSENPAVFVDNEPEAELKDVQKENTPEKETKIESESQEEKNIDPEEKKLMDVLEEARNEYAKIDFKDRKEAQETRKGLGIKDPKEWESNNITTVKARYNNALQAVKDYKFAKLKSGNFKGKELENKMKELIKYLNCDEIFSYGDARYEAQNNQLKENMGKGFFKRNWDKVRLGARKAANFYDKKVHWSLKIGVMLAALIPGAATWAVGATGATVFGVTKRTWGAFMMGSVGAMKIDKMFQLKDKVKNMKDVHDIMKQIKTKENEEEKVDWEKFKEILDKKADNVDNALGKYVRRSKINKVIAITAALFFGSTATIATLDFLGFNASQNVESFVSKLLSLNFGKSAVTASLTGAEFPKPPASGMFANADVNGLDQSKLPPGFSADPNHDFSKDLPRTAGMKPGEIAKGASGAYEGVSPNGGAASAVEYGQAGAVSHAENIDNLFKSIPIEDKSNFWVAIDHKLDGIEPGGDHIEATRKAWQSGVAEYAAKHEMSFDDAARKLSKVYSGTEFSMTHDENGWHAHFDDKNIKFMRGGGHHIGSVDHHAPAESADYPASETPKLAPNGSDNMPEVPDDHPGTDNMPEVQDDLTEKAKIAQTNVGGDNIRDVYETSGKPPDIVEDLSAHDAAGAMEKMDHLVKLKSGTISFLYDDLGNAKGIDKLFLPENLQLGNGRDLFVSDFDARVGSSFTRGWLEGRNGKLLGYLKIYKELKQGGHEKEAGVLLKTVYSLINQTEASPSLQLKGIFNRDALEKIIKSKN